MKTKRSSSRPARPAKSKPARRAAKRAARSPAAPSRAAASAGKRAAAPRAGRTPPSKAARAASTKRAPRPSSSRRRRAPDAPAPARSKWLAFVEEHGVVLASARGPVPSVAEAVAGEPIVGSWWAHPKGKAIFAALSELDDSDDVRCFKLVDGKVTFVHRRVWPALARLASDGLLPADRVASIQQEHMPTGEHRNLITPYPDWVPDDVVRAASALTADDARAQLGLWL